MNRRRRPVVSVAVAVIGGVTAFLLFRLSQRQSAPVITIAPVVAATPASLLPSVLPIVDEASAPASKWVAAVSGAVPSLLWKIAFERDDSRAQRTDLWTANGDGTDAHCVLTDAQSPCWSPLRRMLAFARGGNVWVANADGTSARPLTFWPATSGEHAVTINGIAWNAHDNVLSFAREASYHVTDEDGGTREDVRGSTLYHLALKPGATARATVALPFAPVAFENVDPLRRTRNTALWRRIPRAST